MLSMRLGDTVATDLKRLVGALSANAVASPLRSTVPLVDFWRMPEPRLVQLSAAIGIDMLPPTVLCFEFPVPVQRGRGKSSFTDLMIVAGSAAVAVEAKFTEPPSETVRTWLRNPPEANRSEVLEGWLDLIRAASGTRLSAADVMDLPYQMIHRTASVCYVSRPVRAVVYQVFGGDPLDYYVNSLSDLLRRLGKTDTIKFHVLGCPLDSLQTHTDLVQRWKKKKRDPLVGNAVREELRKGSLFSFREPTGHSIQG